MICLLAEKNKRKFDFAITYNSIVYFNFDKLTMRMFKQEGDDGQGTVDIERIIGSTVDYGSLRYFLLRRISYRKILECQNGLL